MSTTTAKVKKQITECCHPDLEDFPKVSRWLLRRWKPFRSGALGKPWAFWGNSCEWNSGTPALLLPLSSAMMWKAGKALPHFLHHLSASMQALRKLGQHITAWTSTAVGQNKSLLFLRGNCLKLLIIMIQSWLTQSYHNILSKKSNFQKTHKALKEIVKYHQCSEKNSIQCFKLKAFDTGVDREIVQRNCYKMLKQWTHI